jgi:hypothetical protein
MRRSFASICLYLLGRAEFGARAEFSGAVIFPTHKPIRKGAWGALSAAPFSIYIVNGSLGCGWLENQNAGTPGPASH